MTRDNLAKLKMLQEKQQSLQERLKAIATDSLEFNDAQAVLIQITKDIEAIMQEINTHNKRLNQMLNEGHEHAFGERIQTAISFQL